MPRKLRIPVVAAVLIVLIVLGAIISQTGSSTAFPELPVPNGYDDLVKAGEAIKGDLSGLSELNESELQSLVTTNAEPLHLLRIGLTRRCSVPTAQVIRTLNSGPAISLIRLAQLKAAEGRLAEMQGKLVEAAECYLADLQLGNEICRGGFVLDSIAGRASETIGGILLAKLVRQLTPDQSLLLIQKLEALDCARVDWSEVSRNERMLMRQWTLKHLYQPTDSIKGLWHGAQHLKACEVKHEHAVARVRLLTAELALCCYRSNQGQAPSGLDNLVPQYLQRVPVDPFSGQPLAYQAQGTNWTLYSVGSGSGRLFYDSR